MCCQQTPHDDQEEAEPYPCARCYQITGTPSNRSSYVLSPQAPVSSTRLAFLVSPSYLHSMTRQNVFPTQRYVMLLSSYSVRNSGACRLRDPNTASKRRRRSGRRDPSIQRGAKRRPNSCPVTRLARHPPRSRPTTSEPPVFSFSCWTVAQSRHRHCCCRQRKRRTVLSCPADRRMPTPPAPRHWLTILGEGP